MLNAALIITAFSDIIITANFSRQAVGNTEAKYESRIFHLGLQG